MRISKFSLRYFLNDKHLLSNPTGKFALTRYPTRRYIRIETVHFPLSHFVTILNGAAPALRLLKGGHEAILFAFWNETKVFDPRFTESSLPDGFETLKSILCREKINVCRPANTLQNKDDTVLSTNTMRVPVSVGP